MKTLVTAILCLWFACPALAGFTEFYVQTTGSNLNAGSTTDDAALVTSTNGNWDSSTGVFVCNGATDLSAVAVGMWASVYVDGATVGVFVGRISAVVDATDTITVNVSATGPNMGTAPSTSATGRTIKIGGAWKGPNAAEAFPIGIISNRSTNAANEVPRVNLKSGTAYSVTAAMTHSLSGPVRLQGYTSTPGDFGRAVIDGGTSGASYTVLTVSGVNTDWADITFTNNGATGSATAVAANANECLWERCAFVSMRGKGASAFGTQLFLECEASENNEANASTLSGFAVDSGAMFIRCISHDNAGANTSGFIGSGGGTFVDCIADSNGQHGYSLGGTATIYMKGCVAYNNGADGILFTAGSAASVYVEGALFFNNAGVGFNNTGAPGLRTGALVSSWWGSGTQTNDLGNVVGTLGGLEVIGGTNLYTSDLTPWVDPANGDFRPTSTALIRAAGRGTFLQTQSGYAGTVSYPDVGAVQSVTNAAVGAAAVTRSYIFGQ